MILRNCLHACAWNSFIFPLGLAFARERTRERERERYFNLLQNLRYCMFPKYLKK